MKGSPEFALAVECCRRNFRGATPSAVPAAIDWQAFLRVVRFHRVEGLAWRALSRDHTKIPDNVRRSLSEAAAGIADRNLRATAESRLLQDRFQAAGLTLILIKGQSLGALAYDNGALKSAIDIDLLIDPTRLRQAADCLRGSGFDLAAPRASAGDRVLQRWHRSWKESVWRKSGTGIQVDLHTRLADNRRMIPAIGVHSPKQWVSLARDVAVPTLADDELFAYLAVHGASSAWFRLKWIADFAAFLSGRDIERLYARSQALGAGRASGQALLLADALFNSLTSVPGLKQQLVHDRATHRLFEAALTMVTRLPIEPTEQFLGTLPIHLGQMSLLPGASFRWSEMRRHASRLLTSALS